MSRTDAWDAAPPSPAGPTPADLERLVARAVRHFERAGPDADVGFCSSAKFGEAMRPSQVYVAIARPCGACVLQVPASDWRGMDALPILGFEPTVRRKVLAKSSAPKRKR